MIIKTNKVIFKNKNPFIIEKDKILEEKIFTNWNNFIIGKTDFFNGDIYAVTNIKNENNNYEIELGKAKFADLVYAREKSNNYTMYPFFASIILKTTDNYYVVVRNRRDKINTIGGMASTEDFINDVFSPVKCLERELKEEVGLSLNDKKDILNYEASFLKIPSTENNMYPCGVIFLGTLNYTKEEFTAYYLKNKEHLDDEIKELLFYTKDNYQDINKESDKQDYIIEIINQLEN